MLGLHLDRGTARVRRDLPEPLPGPSECAVAVRTVGVCATDLALKAGYMGFCGVPGHEFVGVALSGPLAGRRVVGDINAGCGRCARCRGGDSRHCPDRTVLGILGRSGAFAERIALPEANLIEVPSSVPDDRAVFAEPLAAALALWECPELRGCQRAAVVGDGRLGLLCAWVLGYRGVQVDLFGRHPERARWMVPSVVHMGRPLEAGREETGSYPVVVEASGRPELLQTALDLVEPRGALLLKTTGATSVDFDPAPVVVFERRLVGTRCGRLADAMDLLARGGPPVQEWVQGRYPLARADAALEDAARGGRLKILVDVASASAALPIPAAEAPSTQHTPHGPA